MSTLEVKTATGAGSWAVPSGVTSVTLQGIGGGGSANAASSGGGAGAAFAASTISVTPGQTLYYNVGVGGGTSTTGQTWAQIGTNAAPASSSVGILAPYGPSASGAAGATAVTSGAIGTTVYYGGNGGTCTGGVGHGGPGGGGSAGPTGAGRAGGSSGSNGGGSGGGGSNGGSSTAGTGATSNTGGIGGQGTSGSGSGAAGTAGTLGGGGGGGTYAGGNGGAGGSDTAFDASHGAGGGGAGGAGGISNGGGANGGLYGGAGGGAGSGGGAATGVGAQGILVIAYAVAVSLSAKTSSASKSRPAGSFAVHPSARDHARVSFRGGPRLSAHLSGETQAIGGRLRGVPLLRAALAARTKALIKLRAGLPALAIAAMGRAFSAGSSPSTVSPHVPCGGRSSSSTRLRPGPKLSARLPARAALATAVRAVSNSATQIVNLYAAARAAALFKFGPRLSSGLGSRSETKVGVFSWPAWPLRVSARGGAAAVARANPPTLTARAISLYAQAASKVKAVSIGVIYASLAGMGRTKLAVDSALPKLPVAVRAKALFSSLAGAVSERAGALRVRMTLGTRAIFVPRLATRLGGHTSARGTIGGHPQFTLLLRAVAVAGSRLGVAFIWVTRPLARATSATRTLAHSFAASPLSGHGRLAAGIRPRLRYPIRATGISHLRVAETGTPRLQLTVTKVRATSQTSSGAGFRGLTWLRGRAISLVRGQEQPALGAGLSGRTGGRLQIKDRWGLAVRLAGKIRAGTEASGLFLGKTALNAGARLAQSLSTKPRLALRNLAGATALKVAGRTRAVASLLSGISRLGAGLRAQAYAFKLGQLAQGFSFFGRPRHRSISMVKGAVTLSACLDLLPPIDAGVEQEWVTFDYGRVLVAGVTIVSATVTCAVESGSGTDTAPSTRLVGLPAVIASPRTGAPRAAAAQMVGNCQADVVYQFQCVAHTSDGQTLSLWGRLSCVNPE